MRVFKIRCREARAQALAAAVAAEREHERQWWTAGREAIAQRVAVEGLRAAERAALAGQLAGEFDQLRESGQLRGTRTAFVLPALQAILTERGWLNRRWHPAPRRPRGRPWGTHDEHLNAWVSVDLPDGIGETLARACHWASVPAVAELQRWYDRHGDHWRGQLHNPQARYRGIGPSPADLGQREELIAQVYTTGRVLREAIDRALGVEGE